MQTYIIHPKDKEQSKVLEAFLKALEVPFEASNKSRYNPEFVAKIKESQQEVKEGKVTRVSGNKELKAFLGIDD